MGLGLANAYGAVAGRKALKDIIAEREMAAIDEQQRALQEQTIRAQSSRADEQLALQRRAQQRLEDADKAEADRQWYAQMRAKNDKETADISMENALKGVDPSRANVLRAVYKATGKVNTDDILQPKKRKDVSFYVNGREQHGSYDETTGQYFDAQGKQVLNPGGKPPEPKGETTAKDMFAVNQANAKRSSTAKDTMSVIRELIDPEKRTLQEGVSAGIGPWDQLIPDDYVGNFKGALAQHKVNLISQLTAQQFMDGVQQMRGMGALSDAEGKKIAASVTAMKRNLDDAAFYKEVRKIYDAMNELQRIVILPDGREKRFSTTAAADEMRDLLSKGGG